MSSIQDFFSKSFGAVEAPIERITHGTTYQRWTFGCCSSCCQCIPTSTDYYAYEMWGQGAGGAYGRCCQGSTEGGTGSGHGGVRISYLSCSSNRQMCFCACSCYCCGDGDSCGGHCGQFTRMCLCGLGHCSVKGGGCISGGSECWYVITDGTCNDCWITERNTENAEFGGAGGGGAIYTNCCQSNNVCMFNPDPDVSDLGDNGASSSDSSGRPSVRLTEATDSSTGSGEPCPNPSDQGDDVGSLGGSIDSQGSVLLGRTASGPGSLLGAAM